LLPTPRCARARGSPWARARFRARFACPLACPMGGRTAVCGVNSGWAGASALPCNGPRFGVSAGGSSVRERARVEAGAPRGLGRRGRARFQVPPTRPRAVHPGACNLALEDGGRWPRGSAARDLRETPSSQRGEEGDSSVELARGGEMPKSRSVAGRASSGPRPAQTGVLGGAGVHRGNRATTARSAPAPWGNSPSFRRLPPSSAQ